MSPYPPIEAVLPHRSPMLLLDRILDDGTDSIACGLRIGAASPFVEDGTVPAVIATEYMAQCVAAFAGLSAVRRGAPVQLGYLVGVRRLDLRCRQFMTGDDLVVHARRVWSDAAIGQFDCTVLQDERLVASALLNVYQGDIDSLDANGAIKR